LTAANDHGFAIDEAEVVYWGRCPQCLTAPVTGGQDPTPQEEKDRRV
jgi:Fur family ferric uptake transcriptional regulator